MSLSLNFPTIRPTLNLDFASVGMLDPRVTFTRASTATYYNGVTTAKAEENLVTYSQEFDNAIWGKDNGSVSSNTTAAPDGTTTADTFTENSANDIHRLNFGGTGAPAGIVTCSVFVKAGAGTRYPTVGIASGNAAYASATFDLSTGTNTQTLSAGYSGVSASIQNTGGGWYRCVLTATTTATANFYVALSNSSTFVNGFRGAQVYTGDNTSTLIFWGAQLEQRSAATAYTATTTQAITNYVPVLLTAQNDVPRFDHNPTTGAALGLLIEEQRTNLETYSDDFSNAYWNKNNATVSSNVIIAPDGNLTGDKLITDSGLTNGQVFGTATLAASTTYTFSCFAKAGEWSWTNLATRGPENIDIGAWFNLSAGTVGTVSAGVTASITPVGNGWYRCAVTRTTGTGAATSRQRIHSTNADNAYSTGDGTSGIYIWGAQLEVGAFATSYIPTTTTALTRNADVASMTGANFSSWYNASEGTLFAIGSVQRGFREIVGVSEGVGNDRIVIQTGSSSGQRIIVTTLGVQQALQSGSYTLGQTGKFAAAYATNSAIISVNGGISTEGTSVTVPTVTTLNIGNTSNSTGQISGYIQRIAYYPTRLTNAQLQALTL